MRKQSLLVILVAVLTIPLLTGGAAAQSANLENGSINIDINGDGQDEDLNETSITWQMSGGLIVQDVENRGGSTFVTLVSPDGTGNKRAVVSEAVSETGSFERVQVTVPDGGSRTVEIPVEETSVTVVTDADAFYYENDGSIQLYEKPTSDLVTIALVAGTTASLLAVIGAYGFLRRRHERYYKDLLEDESVEINETYDTLRQRIGAWYERRLESKLSTTVGILLIAYTVVAAVGVAPTPGEFWSGTLTQNARFGLIGGVLASGTAFLPAYVIVKRIYDPVKNFVIDFDAKDAYKSAAGAGLRAVGVYSASPRIINDMDVDGTPTSMMSSGGRVYLVRNFNAEENTAEATPPELEDDIELLLNADAIQGNRERLDEYREIARKIMSVMPVVSKIAEFDAVAQLDAAAREDLSIGEDNDGLIGVVENAVEGTKYEDVYSSSDSGSVGEDAFDSVADDDDASEPGGEER